MCSQAGDDLPNRNPGRGIYGLVRRLSEQGVRLPASGDQVVGIEWFAEQIGGKPSQIGSPRGIERGAGADRLYRSLLQSEPALELAYQKGDFDCLCAGIGVNLIQDQKPES